MEIKDELMREQAERCQNRQKVILSGLDINAHPEDYLSFAIVDFVVSAEPKLSVQTHIEQLQNAIWLLMTMSMKKDN